MTRRVTKNERAVDRTTRLMREIQEMLKWPMVDLCSQTRLYCLLRLAAHALEAALDDPGDGQGNAVLCDELEALEFLRGRLTSEQKEANVQAEPF